MPCNVDIRGGRREDHQRVRDVLETQYKQALGAHDIAITYEPAAAGYRVISATRTDMPGQAYAPGDRLDVERKPVDIAEEVKRVLREAGIRVLA